MHAEHNIKTIDGCGARAAHETLTLRMEVRIFPAVFDEKNGSLMDSLRGKL